MTAREAMRAVLDEAAKSDVNFCGISVGFSMAPPISIDVRVATFGIRGLIECRRIFEEMDLVREVSPIEFLRSEIRAVLAEIRDAAKAGP